ncbi:triggering receptor expressed on myeloid cells 1 isoform X2 [Choloepus didactylus]|uniref:triggering receptor expressed on myeloid cells 1 isoform X2 n=1 Tax=Choloepus didactylus TaxID=27675 RepID=UPI00189DB6A6|nr:triggering receptor expressed on myeloid cells 1 isoform X2 [Choloepus didactylus]
MASWPVRQLSGASGLECLQGAHGSSWSWCTCRMRKARLWALLWILSVSELQAAIQANEVEYVLTEGQTLNVSCPFSRQIYLYSQKAWQRLQNGAEPQTLVVTENTSGDTSRVQRGRYMLEDIPEDSILYVRMANLQVEDSGLYRCVIYQPSRDPILLFHPVRLVVTKDPSGTPASGKNPTQNLAQVTTVRRPTTKAQRTMPRTVAQPPLKSTAFHVSTPGPTANLTNVRGISRVSQLQGDSRASHKMFLWSNIL